MTQKAARTLGLLQEYYDEALELTKGSRREGEIVYEYLRGNQLPDDVVNLLYGRNQPLRWENIISEMDTSLGGIMQMSKIQIKVNSRNNANPEGALVREMVHQSTVDSTEWDSKKSALDRDLRMVGLSCAEVSLHSLGEADVKGKPIYELKHERLPALECLIDMYSRKSDYSDARYFHHSRLYDKRTLKRRFSSMASSIDKLAESNRGMVRITRTWYHDDKGDIRIALWAEGVLLEDKPQPYTKTQGRFSVVVRRLHLTHVKEYYGMYRDILPLQDDVNFSMLRVKNMLSSIKVIIEASGVDDVDTFIGDFSQDNSVSVVNDGTLSTKRLEVINMANNIGQILQLIQDTRVRAKQIMGISPELLGTSTQRQSGVAIQMKQNAGLVGFQPLISASQEQSKDIFEIDAYIMEQWFNAETVFAITGRNGDKEHFYLNAYERDEKGLMVYDDNSQPKQKNILSSGRYSYTLVEVPYNDGSPDAKMRAWGEIMKTVPEKYTPYALPAIMRDMGSPQAEEMQNIIKDIDEKEAQAQQQNQGADPAVQQMQLQMQTMQAKIEEMMSKANLNNAKAGEIAGAKSEGVPTPLSGSETPEASSPPAQDTL